MAKWQQVGSRVLVRPGRKQGFLYDHHRVMDTVTTADVQAGCPYFKESHNERLQRASSTKEFSDIALEVLGLIPEGDIHIVLGPSDDYCAISVATKNIRQSKRVEVFNALPIQVAVARICKALGVSNSERHDCIVEQVYKALLCSGRITHAWFLKGWENCPTAKKQRALLAGKGVVIMDYRKKG